MLTLCFLFVSDASRCLRLAFQIPHLFIHLLTRVSLSEANDETSLRIPVSERLRTDTCSGLVRRRRLRRPYSLRSSACDTVTDVPCALQ